MVFRLQLPLSAVYAMVLLKMALLTSLYIKLAKCGIKIMPGISVLDLKDESVMAHGHVRGHHIRRNKMDLTKIPV